MYTLGVILMNYMGEEALQAAVEVLDSEIAEDGDEVAVKNVVLDYYEAVKAGDFERAYTYFGPTFRGAEDKATWITNQRSSGVTDATVKSLNVDGVESQATATADVSLTKGNGSTDPSHVTWRLVREGGEWKLDSQPPRGPLA